MRRIFIILLCIISLVYPIVSTNLTSGRKARYRVIDMKGNFTIDPKFEIIGDFSEGLVRAIMDNKGVYINKSGKIVIDIGIDSKRIISCGDFSEGLAAFTSKEMGDDIMLGIKNAYNKQGYIKKTGRVVIPPKFEFAKKFVNGFANVFLSGKHWFLINKKGEIVLDTKKFKFGLEHVKFSEGLAAIKISEKWDNKPKNGFLFYSGKSCFINKKGNIVIKGDFTGANNFSEGLAVIIQNSGVYSNLSGGSNKYKQGKFGFINKKGKIVIKTKFYNAKSFSEGFAAVCNKKRKWGYINKKGKMKIKPSFEEAYSFSCGVARVKINGKFGYIDKSGDYIIQATFENAKDFSQCYAAVEKSGRWGYIDTNGKYFIEPKFLEAHSFSEGFARVKVEVDNNEL